MDKPFSAACERNKTPILQVLHPLYAGVKRVLEVGSGTGQHAVHFAAALPHLVWQCSDVPAHLAGMQLWLDEAALPNLPPPLALDVSQGLPRGPFDAVFTANTLHIMGWDEVQCLFGGLESLLPENGLFPLELRLPPFHVGQLIFQAAGFGIGLPAQYLGPCCASSMMITFDGCFQISGDDIFKKGIAAEKRRR